MAIQVPVDVEALHCEVRAKYAEVSQTPTKRYHFHTGRPLAERLRYPGEMLDELPEECVESFAGVGNPFSLGEFRPGDVVVDVGSGAGFDNLIAGRMVGDTGSVVGVDMTPEMLQKARDNAERMGAANVSFREGLVEKLPVPDAYADVVISNGVINLVPQKEAALREIFRIMKPGGRLYLADIVVRVAVPDSARGVIDLWTD